MNIITSVVTRTRPSWCVLFSCFSSWISSISLKWYSTKRSLKLSSLLHCFLKSYSKTIMQGNQKQTKISWTWNCTEAGLHFFPFQLVRTWKFIRHYLYLTYLSFVVSLLCMYLLRLKIPSLVTVTMYYSVYISTVFPIR